MNNRIEYKTEKGGGGSLVETSAVTEVKIVGDGWEFKFTKYPGNPLNPRWIVDRKEIQISSQPTLPQTKTLFGFSGLWYTNTGNFAFVDPDHEKTYILQEDGTPLMEVRLTENGMLMIDIGEEAFANSILMVGRIGEEQFVKDTQIPWPTVKI